MVAPAQMTSSLRSRLLTVLAVAAATVAASSGPAAAQAPDDASAVDQYVEPVPTSGGSSYPGTGKPKKTNLPRSVAAAIRHRGGADAALLTEVASSSVYGAPESAVATGKAAGGRKGPGKRASKGNRPARGGAPTAGGGGFSSGEAASAAADAVGGAESQRVVALLVALALVTAVALSAAALRRRRSAP